MIADFKSLGLPFGVRYYSFLSNDSKLFFNAYCSVNIPISVLVQDEEKRDILTLEGGTALNYIFGVGYQYGNRISIELRHETSYSILKSYLSYGTGYKNSSLIFGINLF